MKHFAGLDVSLEWTSVRVVDEAGQIVREAKVLSEGVNSPRRTASRVCR